MKKISQSLEVKENQIEPIKQLFKVFGYYIDIAEYRDIFATYLYTEHKDGKITKEVWIELVPDYRNNSHKFNIVFEKVRY